MNWNYLQEWGMSMLFFAPGIIIMGLAVLVMPLGKAKKLNQTSDVVGHEGRRVAPLHTKTARTPP